MTKWIELAPSSFSPAAGSLPAPDYWCTPWTVWTPGPDPPKFYLERNQTYNIHVPEGKRATRVDLQFIGYRKKNWKDNLINPYVNGYQTEDNRITDGYVLTSDSGTCAAGWYKFHFSARTNVTLRLEDAKGDARFVATHILLEVEDGPTTTTPFPTSSPPGTTMVTVTVTPGRPTPTPVSQSIPAPTPGTDLSGEGPVVITSTRTGGTLSVSNSIDASDSLSTEVSSTDASAPTAPPGDDAPPSRSRTGLLGLLALGCLAIVASF